MVYISSLSDLPIGANYNKTKLTLNIFGITLIKMAHQTLTGQISYCLNIRILNNNFRHAYLDHVILTFTFLFMCIS